jgi:hypothetical protein
LRRGAGEACFGSADVGETTKLTGGARVAVTEEEGIIARLRKLEEEAAFGKYAKAGIKIGFLNLPRIWKFVEGDLGGILT